MNIRYIRPLLRPMVSWMASRNAGLHLDRSRHTLESIDPGADEEEEEEEKEEFIQNPTQEDQIY